MSGGGSVVVRRQLGMKLRQLRLAARKDVADVTAAGLGSKAKISRIETGKCAIKVADVRALCWLYGVDGPATDALAKLAPATHENDWWHPFAPLLPSFYLLYASLEVRTTRIRAFEPRIVHGLLQTQNYATALFRGDPRLSEETIEERVQFRLERQRQVVRPVRPPEVEIILGESALHIQVGSPAVMTEEIAHLVDRSAHPNISVRVLPFSAGHFPDRGCFSLLDFDDPDDPAIAYLETSTSGTRYIDKPTERAEYEYLYDLARSKSVLIEEWMERRIDSGDFGEQRRSPG